MSDVDTVLKLPAATFIQVVTVGMSNKLMSDPRIQDKLRQDLALMMAQAEDGIKPINQRDLANALYKGDLSGLSNELLTPVDVTTTSKDGVTTVVSKNLYEIVLADYQTILKGLQDQDLDAVFDISTNPTAHKQLNDIASCGIDLRNSGGLAIADTNGAEAVLLADINRFPADPKTTDDQIKKAFNLPSDTLEMVIRKLRQSNPHKTKQQFLEDSSYNRQGITAYSLWSAFDQNEGATLNAVNEFLKRDNLGDDDIKRAFRVSSNEEIKKYAMVAKHSPISSNF